MRRASVDERRRREGRRRIDEGERCGARPSTRGGVEKGGVASRRIESVSFRSFFVRSGARRSAASVAWRSLSQR